jgi:hypothetical protein
MWEPATKEKLLRIPGGGEKMEMMPGDPPIENEGLGGYLMDSALRTSGSCTWFLPPDPNYKPAPRRFYCAGCKKEYKTDRHLAWVPDYCEDYEQNGFRLCKKCWKAIGARWK